MLILTIRSKSIQQYRIVPKELQLWRGLPALRRARCRQPQVGDGPSARSTKSERTFRPRCPDSHRDPHARFGRNTGEFSSSCRIGGKSRSRTATTPALVQRGGSAGELLAARSRARLRGHVAGRKAEAETDRGVFGIDGAVAFADGEWRLAERLKGRRNVLGP